MDSDTLAGLKQLEMEALDGMRTYIVEVADDGGDPGYTEADIAKCQAIIDEFLVQVEAAGGAGREAVLAAVKEAVLALNLLNESCDHSLIETDQREQLAEIILQAAAAAGVGSGEDITEEWRDW